MKYLLKLLAFTVMSLFSCVIMAVSDMPLSPDEGGARNWQVIQTSKSVILFRESQVSSEQVLTLSPGDILDNLDCMTVQDVNWCYVQPIGGGPVGYVMANYLTPAKSRDGTIGYGLDDSSLRAGQGDFDATGNIPCAQNKGQPMTQCEFSVSRAGSGYATVVIHRQGQSDRVIYFRMGRAIGVSSSEADKAGEFSMTYEHDLHKIKVGDERYEIPDAVIFGG